MNLTTRELSSIAVSNIYTKMKMEPFDTRQFVGSHPFIPSVEIRRLCAKLIMEEALETVNALGFYYHQDEDDQICEITEFPSTPTIDLDEIIDGSCDLQYVAGGLLVACGVPDLPHIEEVCKCNNAKFLPGQTPTFDSITGKYLKPPGWKPPDHAAIREKFKHINLREIVS